MKNTEALIEALVTTKDNGVNVKSRETVHTGFACFAEVATPKTVRALGGDLVKACYVVSWRGPEVAAGTLWTLGFDSKTYALRVPRHDQIGGYRVGTLDRLS